MEPQNPTVPTPPPQVTSPAVSPVELPKPKKNNLTVILLSVFLLITLLISEYLFLQVQKLNKELADLQVQPTPTPLTTEIPSPTPDPTANWETYTNNQYNYSLKIPQDWVINAEEKSPAQSKIDPGQKISKIKFNNEASSVEIFYEGDWDHGFEPWVFEKKETINLGGKDANLAILGLDGKSSKWYIISIESFNNFRIEANIDPGDSKTFNQILSTFKFTD